MLRALPLLLPIPVFASDAAAPGLSGGNYLQALLALMLIVGLLAGTAWLARKVTGGKGFGQGGMKVVGGVALGPRERIVLIEVGDTWLVIGLVPGQIRTLYKMPKGELSVESALTQGLQGGHFAELLKRVSQKGNPR
ncbi:flagellar biosynthetic protein FliO [Dechloromonas sp.]|uniref:flagellar biosynthetic protein FliO n=1 Tax=Dechloromonas sp. TaxID=1917218 RepID=UPI00263F884F|nr:flagellar biosynthetic protein FliO [Dechloromonas sp.]